MIKIKSSTPPPKDILNKLDSLIKDNKITSWKGNQKNGYTHSSKIFQAVVEPEINQKNNILTFKYKNWKNIDDPEDNHRAYAEYHGYLLSTLLQHFKESIEGYNIDYAYPTENKVEK